MYLTAASLACGAQAPSLITAHNFLVWRQKESIGRVGGKWGRWGGRSPAQQVRTWSQYSLVGLHFPPGWMGLPSYPGAQLWETTLSHPSRGILSPTYSSRQLPFTSHSGGLCSLGHKRHKWLGHLCPRSKCLRTCGGQVVRAELRAGLDMLAPQEGTQRGKIHLWPLWPHSNCRKGYGSIIQEGKNEVHKRSKSMDNSVSKLELESITGIQFP